MRLPWRKATGARAFAALPAAPPGVSARAPTGEAGSDGKTWYDGLTPNADPNPELSNLLKYRVYEEMRVSDAVVRGVLWLLKLPIRQADPMLDPATGDPADVAVADCARWQLGIEHTKGRPGPLDWERTLALTMLYLDYGSMTLEIVWGDPVPWVDADGDIHQVRPIVKLGPRYPQTITEYLPPPLGSRDALGGVVQTLAKSTIPGPRLVHLVNEQETNRYTGVSVIRPAYGPWRLKKNLLVSSAIAYDRFSAGIPLIRYPNGGGDPAYQKAVRIARDIRAHERAYIVLEGAEEDGWQASILSGSGSIADPVPLLRHYDLQIASSVVAQFTQLGSTETGSRAVAEAQADPFYLVLQSIARQVAGDLTRQVVARFVEMNFGAEAAVPALEFGKMHVDDVEALGRYVQALAAAGMNMTDTETQNHMRALGGLPTLAEAQATEGTGPPLLGDALAGYPPAPPPPGEPT